MTAELQGGVWPNSDKVRAAAWLEPEQLLAPSHVVRTLVNKIASTMVHPCAPHSSPRDQLGCGIQKDISVVYMDFHRFDQGERGFKVQVVRL